MIVSQPSDATETSLQLLFGNRILHRDSAVFNAVRAQVISQVTFQVGSHVKSQVESHVKPRIKSQMNSHVESQVKCQVSSQIMSQRGTVAGRPKTSVYLKSIRSRPRIAPKRHEELPTLSPDTPRTILKPSPQRKTTGRG